MTGVPRAELEGDPEIVELGSVPGFVVFDLPGAPVSAGGTRSAADATPAQVLAAVEARISELITEALRHPGGPLEGARERAGEFLRGWWGEPPGPPFAPPE